MGEAVIGSSAGGMKYTFFSLVPVSRTPTRLSGTKFFSSRCRSELRVKLHALTHSVDFASSSSVHQNTS